jgi:choline dehydrogenase-like flavoprotein
MPQDIVIGSGSAAVAAASALVDHGRHVLMLDVGTTLEPDKQATRERMGRQAPAEWSREDRAALTAAATAGRSETMQPYGSDFLFRVPATAAGWGAPQDVHDLRPSFAKGGLSNGWGASILPYRDVDLAAWPIRVADLAPHYAAIARLVAASARRDALAPLFPGHALDAETPLPLSAQAAALLARLERRGERLATLGVHVGQSRQAIDRSCRQCAMCLYDCPYGAIFRAADVVDRLVATGSVSYRPGTTALRFAADDTGVTVRVRSRDGAIGEIRGDRLFVAAGVLPTTLLVLDSLDRVAEPVAIRDSAHFFLPLLHGWSTGVDPSTEPRHTLAQLFVEIVDPAIAATTVHTQVYTHNDLFAVDMRRRFGPFADLLRPLIAALSRRLVVAQSFLHSDLSPHIEATLVRDGGGPRLAFRRRDNAQAAAAVTRVRARLARIALLAGMLPLTPLLRPGTLGSSFHCGGSFPMRAEPGPLETDVLGRLPGVDRVHLVDAAVFPSIPATTIAFSAMANAHRIATLACRPR